MANLERLVNELRKYPNETPWLEFKHNNYDPEMIGQDISALANIAALYEKNCAYMLWGIDNATHDIVGAIRERKTAYPVLAIREAVANALIHQDFTITGAGPSVEIFQDRIEITNPGTPLVDVLRIIDNPPRSRNERLADLMRRLGMCEELGTGWDKIAISCELQQLPAPKIELYEGSTRVILYARMPFSGISLLPIHGGSRLPVHLQPALGGQQSG